MELTGGVRVDTLPALIAQKVAAEGGATVLRKKNRGIWNAVTWAEMDTQVGAMRRGLRAMDFGRGDVAAVLSETRPEAVYADLAILTSGGASVAINPNDEADRVGHILRSAGCRVIFVEGEEQLDKVLSVRGDCPGLARIVITDMKGLRDFDDSISVSLGRFMAEGSANPSSDPVAPDDTAAIVFPQDGSLAMGRIVTHGDIMRMVDGARRQLSPQPGDERLVVLPMSDPTERVLGLYLALTTGTISNYLESPETAVENLQQLKPTILGANAEAWERLHARITAAADAATPLQRTLYRWAIGAARSGGAMAGLADLLVLRAVRRELGMSRLRLAFVGNEPIPPQSLDWARALGITVRQVTDPAELGQGDAEYGTLIRAAYAAA